MFASKCSFFQCVSRSIVAPIGRKKVRALLFSRKKRTFGGEGGRSNLSTKWVRNLISGGSTQPDPTMRRRRQTNTTRYEEATSREIQSTRILVKRSMLEKKRAIVLSIFLSFSISFMSICTQIAQMRRTSSGSVT